MSKQWITWQVFWAVTESLWDSYYLRCQMDRGKCQGEHPLRQSRFVLLPRWPWGKFLSSQISLRALLHHSFELGQTYFFKLLFLTVSNLDEQWTWFRVSRKADVEEPISAHKGQRKQQLMFSPSLTCTGERNMETLLSQTQDRPDNSRLAPRGTW